MHSLALIGYFLTAMATSIRCCHNGTIPHSLFIQLWRNYCTTTVVVAAPINPPLLWHRMTNVVDVANWIAHVPIVSMGIVAEYISENPVSSHDDAPTTAHESVEVPTPEMMAGTAFSEITGGKSFVEGVVVLIGGTTGLGVTEGCTLLGVVGCVC